jgi:uncharacterized secreted protein with C-terminal beta-propeller domain
MWKINKINLFVIIFFFLFINTSFAFSQIKCDLSKLKPVKFGEKNIYVKNLKLCLKEAGYNFGNVLNSSYDDQMLKAVKNFYKSWYGDVDGKYFGKLGINKLKLLIEDLSKSKINKNLKKFSSEKEFLKYLNEANKKYPEILQITKRIAFSDFLAAPWEATLAVPAEFQSSRYSETNVQVKGIDEADIVKTDGENIYYSNNRTYVDSIQFEDNISPLSSYKSNTKIIKAFPISEINQLADIQETGDLYLIKSKNILIILQSNKIISYDISNPQTPNKKWELNFEGDLITSRLYKDQIYLILRQSLDDENPCSIVPLKSNNSKISLSCIDIYMPPMILPVENIISAFIINPENGQILNKSGFLETPLWYGQTVVYMSKNNLYIVYPKEIKTSDVLIQAILNNLKDILPQEIIAKVEKLKDLDLYDSSKERELEMIFNYYLKTFKKEEREKISKKLEERFLNYYKSKMREFDKSVLIKLDINDLTLKGVGEIPGIVLNQFSLDEYQNNIRIGTTIGERSNWSNLFYLIPFPSGEFISLNDVYILDENLNIIGNIQNLGKGEKIYSVRFIEDKGYIVTFRETDPFYILDLSNPYDPKLTGELKIPGYSSYLHPIDNNRILGIGKEGNKVKISLFDVSNPSTPIEKSKYILNEYWSDILDNFHAFLLDNKHEIFFIPGYRKAYLFSYKDNKLEIKKEISSLTSIERAIYIDDYLYLISRSNIIIFDENTFDKVKELNLK